MKTISPIIFILTMAVINPVSAQKTALEYLKNVHQYPDSVCTCLLDVRQNYEASLSNFYDLVTEDIHARTTRVDEYMDQNQDRMKASMMKEMADKSGMSQQELEALSKKKKLTQEDKQALMDKALGQHNLSMGEVQNMKNMDENARKAWAEAYATEQMAMAQGNSNNPKVKADNDKAMSQSKLLQEQQSLRSQLSAFETEIANRYNTLMQTSGKEKLVADLQELENELRTIGTIYECNECPPPPASDVKHWNTVIQKIHDTKMKYCRQNTPKLIAYLNWYSDNLVKNIPVYDRSEAIQYEVTSATTNTQLSPPDKGIFSLKAVQGYLSAKQKLFEIKDYEIESFVDDFMK